MKPEPPAAPHSLMPEVLPAPTTPTGTPRQRVEARLASLGRTVAAAGVALQACYCVVDMLPAPSSTSVRACRTSEPEVGWLHAWADRDPATDAGDGRFRLYLLASGEFGGLEDPVVGEIRGARRIVESDDYVWLVAEEGVSDIVVEVTLACGDGDEGRFEVTVDVATLGTIVRQLP